MTIDEIESQPAGSKDDGALIDVEDSRRLLIKRITQKFDKLEPPLTSKCCIYRVRGSLRKLNEDAYTPRVISIGPFHRGKKELQIMEKHKERYLHDFLLRAETYEVSLGDFVTSIGEWEEEIRRCYAETIKLNSNDFIEMILLDGSFIIERILRSNLPRDLISENDEVLYKPWLGTEIWSDLRLLENQLPFFILEELYNLAFPNYQGASFLEFACSYFSYYNLQKKIPQGPEVKHFTDLLRTFHLPLSPTSPTGSTPTPTEKQTNLFSNSAKKLHAAGVKFKASSSNCFKHFTELVRISHPPLSPTRLPPKEKQHNQFSYNATELHEAGVKFEVSSSKCIFDIIFTEGVLQIPHLHIHDDTERLIRNLMALEQCHYPDERNICHYIDLMDTLINTPKDVELLVQNGIISNWLGDNQAVATLFNKMGQEIVLNVDKSCFIGLGNDLTDYCKIPWHKYQAILKRDYFSTPWRFASIVAAFILLVLTFMQTVNSFISL